MTWLKYLGYGWLILLAAIVVNILSVQIGAVTWYSHIDAMSAAGFREAVFSLSPLNGLFLYILYPSIFGGIVKLAVDSSHR